MKVALVHDFLIEYGGAERVLEALHEVWPKAPVYTAFYNPDSLGKQAQRFEGWDIRTSWGTRLPFWKKLVSPYRVFSKSFFEKFDLSSYDLVISSSNAYMAKAVKVPNGVHICYCHTPPRFLYGYPTPLNWRKNRVLKFVGLILNHFMRVWDFEAAQAPSRKASEGRGRVDYFIANSKEVQARIMKFYRRESDVIYPPVDINKYQLPKTNNQIPNTKKYFLAVSRLAAPKNIGLAVEVCTNLNLNLKVVGTGREMENLKKLAGETVEFLGDVTDEELIKLYQNCRAVFFLAAQEDFGLVPVEAMAAGKPVIALAQGGVLETVVDGKTGIYVRQIKPGSLVMAINTFLEMEKKGKWNAADIKKHAQKFGKERFKKEIMDFVKEKVK